jgi:outer membrane protein
MKMVRKTLFLLLVTTFMITSVCLAADNTASAPLALTLEKCLELAAANNQDLKATTQNLVIAKEKVKIAEGGLLPSADYQFGYTKLDDKPVVMREPVFIKGDDQSFSGKLSATYPLYTGGKLQNAVKISLIELEMARADEAKARQKLTCDVKDAFYKIWLAEEQLKVAQSSYQNLNRHVDQVEKHYKAGATSKFELLRAEVQRDTLKPQVIKAENGVSLAKLALATLIGLKKEQPFAVDFDIHKVALPDSPAVSFDDSLNRAYSNRPELKQVQFGAEAAKVQEDLAEAHNKPNVSLVGTYDGNGSELNPGSWDRKLSLSIAVQGNFYKGTNKPEINKAKAQTELYVIKEAGLKDAIRLEVDQVLQSLKESLETAKANQANIELAKESLRLTEVRFDAGMATTMDIMDSQLALDKALTGYYSNLADYLAAQAKLALVTGQE